MKIQQRQDEGAKVSTHEKVGMETVDTGEGVVSFPWQGHPGERTLMASLPAQISIMQLLLAIFIMVVCLSALQSQLHRRLRQKDLTLRLKTGQPT